jgi:ATP-binding cassette subfamily B protein
MSAGESQSPPKQAQSLVGVLRFLGAYPGAVLLSVALLLVNLALELALPQVLGEAITNLSWHVQWRAEFQPGVYAALLGSLVLVRAGVAILLGPIRNRLIQRVLADIRAAIYDAIQRLAFHYHDKTNTGELISRSTTDVWRLQDFLFACLFLSLDIAVALVATVALIFSVSAALGLVALATMAPTIGLIAYFARQLQPRWRKIHDLHGAMTTVIQENIAGVRVVKAFAQEPAEIAKFRGRRDEFLRTLTDAVNFWAARVPFAQFIFGLSVPLVLWIGGNRVIHGQLALGGLAMVVFYLMAIGHRMGMIGQFTSILQNAGASAARVLEVVNEPQGLVSGSQAMPRGGGEVRFESVSFRYFDGKASLSEVSFVAPAGQTTAIVGPTGSGKTTLVNLIPRFYDASAGCVRVDGVEVRELNLRQLRTAVGVIFQETFLFSATVAENIAYGRPTATREQIEAAAKAAQAHEFILELEAGYETVVGERGVTLSGGQKQRITMARAFLLDPRILILDDATASVDPQTERLIRQAMRRLCAGRTTFVIAHRLATVQEAAQILVLNEGRLVERGTHAELIGRSGFYREVFQHQIHG